MNSAQLKALGILEGPLRTSFVGLPAGRAAHFVYHARIGGAGTVFAITQFLFVRAGDVTVLTYTTLPRLEARYRAAFTASARSFKFNA